MENMQNILDKAVEIFQSRGIRDIIAKMCEKTDHQIRFSNNQIDISKQWNNRKLDVLIGLDGGKVAVAEFQNPTIENIRSRAENEISLLKKLPANFLYKEIATTTNKLPHDTRLYDKSITYFEDQAPGLINNAISASLEEGAQKVAGVLYYGYQSIGMKNSSGFEGSYDSSNYRFTIRSFVDAESSGQDILCGRQLNDLKKKFTIAGANSGKIARMAMNGTQGKGGTYDLLMSPTVAANIFGEVVSGANPLSILLKMSCLENKEKQSIGPAELTIKDDPTNVDGLNSLPFDDEGVIPKVNTIIDKGIFSNIIHNTSTAKIWNEMGNADSRSTGNSRLESFLGEDSSKILLPSFSNIVYQSGDQSLEEIIANCQRPTIYVTSNWYTRFTSYIDGIFSTIPRDGIFLIENGQIVKPIRKIRIADTLLGMFSRISSIGSDLKQINWWEVPTPTFIPSIKVDNVRITSATE